ncbi:MAG TPA: HD domain-containing phosphohydrolase [Tepidisphaeraceae bacterium]|jgi:putative two-component system response regulator
MRILVAEDDPIAGEMLAEMLRSQGHDVTVAEDGQDAIEHMRLTPFPLVISDWDMPRMNGEQLCREIRSGEWGMYVYFILLSGRGDRQSSLRGYESGADDYISKPFDPDEVTARLRVAQRILQLETHDVTIFALAKLAESRDSDTGKHIERVQAYCQVLAERMLHSGGWPEINASFVKLLFQTSPLHDIGKVSIPDAVLLKPGKLSVSEFELMKTHTTCGADTLAAAAQQRPKAAYLEMARQIALSHHERWDGTGYPQSLAADEIPLAARVVAVADVYDALTSRRQYKEAFPHDQARAIILDGAGTHFDPQIVDVFREVELQFAAIRGQLCERMSLAA